MIPRDCLALWWGNHSAPNGIPANWTRYTALDDKYPDGAAASVEAGGTGGGTTHTHTDPGHSHTLSVHTHDVSGGMTVAGSITRGSGTGNSPASKHNHAAQTSTNATPSVGSATITWANANNPEPPYLKAIFIRPDDNAQLLPRYAGGLWDNASSSPPSPFVVLDGTVSTPPGSPNCNNNFLKGAATGAASGGTGGSAPGSHTHTATAHQHLTAAHSHAEFQCGGTSTSAAIAIAGGAQTYSIQKHHDISLNSAAAENNDATGGIAGGGTTPSEPSYIQASAIINNSAVPARPVIGMVLPYIGLLSAIPAKWQLCDGTSGTFDWRGRQCKMTTTAGSRGGAGGSNTHAHSSIGSHRHNTTATHTHAVSSDFNIDSGATTGAVSCMSTSGHSHTWTVAAASVGYTSFDVPGDVNSADHRQAWYGVQWLKYKGRVVSIGGVTLAGGRVVLTG